MSHSLTHTDWWPPRECPPAPQCAACAGILEAMKYTQCTLHAFHLKGSDLAAAAAGKQRGQALQLHEPACCRAPSLQLLTAGSPPCTTVPPAAPCCRALAHLPSMDLLHHELHAHLVQGVNLNAAATAHACVARNVQQAHRAPQAHRLHCVQQVCCKTPGGPQLLMYQNALQASTCCRGPSLLLQPSGPLSSTTVSPAA